MPERTPEPDDHERREHSSADDAAAGEAAPPPTSRAIPQGLARIVEDVNRTLRPLQDMSRQYAIEGSSINSVARLISKQSFAFDVSRMYGTRGPLYDARKFVDFIGPTSKVGRQIELANYTVQPVIASLAKTITESWLPHQRLIEDTRRAAQALVQTYRASLPANWHVLEGDGLDRAISLATETGLCLVWVPREEIVVELVGAADHDARSLILTDRRVEVLDDLDAVLGDSVDFIARSHEQAHDLAGKAVAAGRDGHDEAAQCLAAAALGLLLHEVLGFSKLGAAYREMSARDIEETVVRLLRITVIELATARALTDTDKHEVGFNRHGTLHGKPEFLSRAYSLSGLLLLAAWVRELAWWQRHQPDAIARS
jgi:hypothetical protein